MAGSASHSSPTPPQSYCLARTDVLAIDDGRSLRLETEIASRGVVTGGRIVHNRSVTTDGAKFSMMRDGDAQRVGHLRTPRLITLMVAAIGVALMTPASSWRLFDAALAEGFFDLGHKGSRCIGLLDESS